MRLSDMWTRLGQRLNEANGPVYYPLAEQTAAINEAQRIFCMITLALETTTTWNAPGYAANGSSPFYSGLAISPNWIVPLRISTLSGAKLRPTTTAELDALDSRWMNFPAEPSRYGVIGPDLLALYGQPAVTTPLNLTYATSPRPLVFGTDVPVIPAEYHPCLVSYGINRLRQQEGGQEFEKTMPDLDFFLTMAQRYAAFVRARNEQADYDKLPYELQKYDRSSLLRLRGSNKPG